jgi:hypothetical protein
MVFGLIFKNTTTGSVSTVHILHTLRLEYTHMCIGIYVYPKYIYGIHIHVYPYPECTYTLQGYIRRLYIKVTVISGVNGYVQRTATDMMNTRNADIESV